MENLILQLEQFVIPITWLILHKTLFPKLKSHKLYAEILFIVVIGGITYLFNDTCLEKVTPAINVFISCIFNGMNEEKLKKEIVVENLSSYMIIRLLWIISVVLALLALNVFSLPRYLWLECMCNCSIQLLLCIIVCRYIDSSKWEIFFSKYSVIIITMAGSLFVLSLSSINIPYVSQTREFRIFAGIVIIGAVVILFTWVHNEHQWQQEEEEQSKHIADLIRRAHKYKEVVPSTARELRRIQKQMLAEHRWEEAEEIGIAIDEVASLGETISADSMRELSEEPDFSTTGLRLLDSQLQNEQETAAEEGIHFSCMVTSPAAFLVKSGLIDQFHLQQMVGDLVRNAIRAVRLREGKDKRLLLIMGQSPEGYQIKLCDTGVPFPPEMLRHFGQRGLTTGGSGHGLADLREIMERCKGSITVTEYGEESSYTKAISLVMDGQGMLRIHSAPSGLDQERSLLEPAESGAK